MGNQPVSESRPGGRRFRQIFTVMVIVAAVALPARAQDMDVWNDFLDRFVVEQARGETAVRYGAVGAEDHAALAKWIAARAAAGPPPGKDAAFAWWVNLYNALTIDVVLDHYPVASIRDIRFGLGLRPGPWREDLVTVDGQALSLDDIEHGILRKDWDEPRVHFAVNCASIGCPALLPGPFTADALESQLDQATADFINSGRAIRIENGRLIASSIFDWYGADFAPDDAGILAYLQGYADPALAAQLDGRTDIDRYGYDWSLNEVE